MKNNILFILSLSTSLVYPAFSQNPAEILVKPVWEFKNPARFTFTYEIDAQGERAVGKAIYTHNFTIEKTGESGDTITFRATADSTLCSNPDFTKNTEEGILYAILGITMEAEIHKAGSFIRLINEAEVINELKSGLKGYSASMREKLINGMVEEDKHMLFSKVFELNYSQLFDKLNKTFSIPFESVTDTLIQESEEGPRTTSRIIERVSIVNGQIEISTIVDKASETFRQRDGLMEYELLPITVKGTNSIILNKSGMLQKATSNISEVSGGFLGFMEGKQTQAWSGMTKTSKLSIELVNQ